jgi:hypothetical protein
MERESIARRTRRTKTPATLNADRRPEEYALHAEQYAQQRDHEVERLVPATVIRFAYGSEKRPVAAL